MPGAVPAYTPRRRLVVGARYEYTEYARPRSFADLLEEPRRHAAAERLIEHAEHVRRGPRRDSAAQPMSRRWTCSTLSSGPTRTPGEAPTDRPRSASGPTSGASTSVSERRPPASWVRFAGRGDHDVRRPVVHGVEARDLRHGLMVLDRLLGPEHLAAERMVGEHRVPRTDRDRSSGVSSRMRISSRITCRSASTSSAGRRAATRRRQGCRGELELAGRARGRRTPSCSWAVNAFMSPPTDSTASCDLAALRSSVPLNSRCSRKWLAPASSSVLVREPMPTHEADASPSAGRAAPP